MWWREVGSQGRSLGLGSVVHWVQRHEPVRALLGLKRETDIPGRSGPGGREGAGSCRWRVTVKGPGQG